MALKTVAVLLCSFATSLAVLPDVGVPNYSCPGDSMKKSKIVMALGDSLTAANGAGAEDPLAVVLQYRGLAFQAGGDKTLDEHATIPNILKKYNPNLFGYSVGIGSPNVWEIAYLNVAMPGANAKDLPGQARQLVSLLKEHTESVNIKEDWKMLNIFIGGNDMCGYCRHSSYAPSICVSEIQEAIQIIYDNVPRVIVSLTTMLHLEILRKTDSGHFFCTRLHHDECGCESNTTFTDADIEKACVEYADLEIQLGSNGTFERDDFSLVVQPFFRDADQPPMKDGKPYMGFFAPDCFHFSQWGHAVVTTWLWKNLLEPVGSKTTNASLSYPSLPLACPDLACPFIRTTKNSADCSEYMTPVSEH
ncbi:unnamed protein product [Caenorhabditis auriculariae]|uniref:Phospholipase B1, membrane-associated n=1 Tax=Caenorhabditis auriculariae TaxID=2777116 RepID=A0A8S1GQF0_9PELO|nr:unnamed protein product [Caenorhabditis auriculariae]